MTTHPPNHSTPFLRAVATPIRTDCARASAFSMPTMHAAATYARRWLHRLGLLSGRGDAYGTSPLRPRKLAYASFIKNAWRKTIAATP